MSLWKDNRFTHIQIDPRFHKILKDKKKTIIDKRFQAIFNNKDFYYEDNLLNNKI